MGVLALVWGWQSGQEHDDILRAVVGVGEEIRILGSNVAAQGGANTQVETRVSDLVEVRGGVIPKEMQSDFRAGELFYQRYLERPFPKLPEEFFIRVLQLRAEPREAQAVQISVIAERELLGVFWAYKGYGNATQGRNFEPPLYRFYVAPLYSQTAMRVYLIDGKPFGVPKVEVNEWVR